MENLTPEELCVHQVCIWKKSSFRESLECMARNGVFKTAVWKPLLDKTELKSAKKKLIDGKWYVELSEVAEIVGGEGKQATPEDMWDYGC